MFLRNYDKWYAEDYNLRDDYFPGVANVPLILDESQANLNASYYGTNVPLILDESRDGGRLSNSVKENVGTWVTIYGFPPAVASCLLQKFSQYGTVCKYEISKNGNWMHVCYQSKLEAKKAISKNGKIIGGSTMVGVKLCDDETVTGMSERDVSSSTSNISLLKDSGVDRTKNSFNRSSMRPLTQAYKASKSDYEVKFNGSILQKNNSLVTKAMEYVFRMVN
ncbi:NUP35 (predicted) [Pycnogonum litorale]